MSSNVLARIAGWSSILSVLLFVPAIALTVMNSGKDTPLATVLFLLSTAVLAPIFYALFVFHRARAQTVALIALVLGIISVVAGIIAPTPTSNAMIFNASSVLGGIALVLFSYLGFQNAKMPRALSIIGILLGVVSILSGVLSSMGMILGSLLLPLFIVWLLWMGWLFLKGRLL